jgi:hypothetical protein
MKASSVLFIKKLLGGDGDDRSWGDLEPDRIRLSPACNHRGFACNGCSSCHACGAILKDSEVDRIRGETVNSV